MYIYFTACQLKFSIVKKNAVMQPFTSPPPFFFKRVDTIIKKQLLKRLFGRVSGFIFPLRLSKHIKTCLCGVSHHVHTDPREREQNAQLAKKFQTKSAGASAGHGLLKDIYACPFTQLWESTHSMRTSHQDNH